MRAILDVILIILDLYIWLLIAAAILSWLVAFNVVNARNQFVAMVGDFLFRVTEPVSSRGRSRSSVTWWRSPRKRRSSENEAIGPACHTTTRSPPAQAPGRRQRRHPVAAARTL